MWCGKCGKCMRLRPISLGLALGITAALAVLIGSVWVMYYGAPPMMEQLHIPVPTFGEAVINSLWVLLKGFIFGLFLALFYDLFACLFAMCCKKSDGKCSSCGAPTGRSKI